MKLGFKLAWEMQYRRFIFEIDLEMVLKSKQAWQVDLGWHNEFC